MRPSSRSAFVAVVTCLAAGIAAAPAAADPCDVTLADAAYEWDIKAGGGYVATGGVATEADKPFDSFNRVLVDPDTEAGLAHPFKPVDPTLDPAGGPDPLTPSCTYEDDGREIAFPPVDVGNDVEVTRKVYVPAGEGGPAFARWVTFIKNTHTTDARTVDLDLEGKLGGSDGDATLVDDSSGDARSDEEDRWIVVNDRAREGDGTSAPAVAVNWDLALTAPLVDDADDIVGPLSSLKPLAVAARWSSIPIAPGETAAVMQVLSQHADETAAVGAADSFASGPAALYAGLSPEELAQLRNWGVDGDGDGSENAADNCPANANAGQADLDADGQGDACDADRDGDGLSDATEANLGTSPSSRDTDGDTVLDNADRCPLDAGPAGCPVTVQTQTQVQVQTVDRPGPVQVVTESLPPTAGPRATPRGLSLSTRARRAGKAVLLSARGRLTLPDGVDVRRACSGGAFAVVVRSGKRIISTRFIELIASDCRFSSALRFNLPARLGKRPLQVRSYFLGNNFVSKATSKVSRPTIR